MWSSDLLNPRHQRNSLEKRGGAGVNRRGDHHMASEKKVAKVTKPTGEWIERAGANPVSAVKPPPPKKPFSPVKRASDSGGEG